MNGVEVIKNIMDGCYYIADMNEPDTIYYKIALAKDVESMVNDAVKDKVTKILNAFGVPDNTIQKALKG